MEHKSRVAMEQVTDPSWLAAPPLPAIPARTLVFRAEAAKGSSGLWQAAVEAHTTLNETIVTVTTVAQKARAMSRVLEEALAVLAVVEADLIRRSPMEYRDSALLASLSAREREVLALVAEGHSNRVIADTLFVSPNTVKSHVASLLNKLHADSRVELATIATLHDVVLHTSQEASSP
jgi:DNA-binding CsgD family transcriptional regulator